MASTARVMTTGLAAVALLVGVPLTLSADTLYLRNGSRIQGDLVGVRGDTVEFRERRGFGGGRTLRLDRDEVDRIEFDRVGNSGRDLGNGIDGRRPGGMRERPVTVSATSDWTDAGLDVRAGQLVYFEASGQVRWGRDRRDGPAGERNSPVNPARPLPNRPGAALLGRIGNDIFYIGDDTGPIRVRTGGRLYLGINDEYLADNSGSFRVTVFY